MSKTALVLTGILLACTAPAHAADYPARPVTLVVAFTPGGPSDVLARIVGKKLEQLLGQPFVIENRPGAGGNIAAEVVDPAPIVAAMAATKARILSIAVPPRSAATFYGRQKIPRWLLRIRRFERVCRGMRLGRNLSNELDYSDYRSY